MFLGHYERASITKQKKHRQDEPKMKTAYNRWPMKAYLEVVGSLLYH